MKKTFLVGVVLALLIAASPVMAGDWPAWRGPYQTGVSDETGLIDRWTTAGENLIWRKDFISRSTPIVMGGRVFVNGRRGTGIDRQGVIAAFDAGTGDLLWEYSFSPGLTTVPFNRVGWASLVGDPETGNIYAQAVDGDLYCLSRDGKMVWSRNLGQEFGRFEGYGGRTSSAVIDENRVIVNVINGSWGSMARPLQRFFAFDKNSGELVWTANGTGTPVDRNVQANPVTAVIGGKRLVILGGGDGNVYALLSRSGELVWEFHLSKRGLNVTPVVDGYRVFIGHSEENIDEGTLGRFVAIDGRGTGDITATHELWRSEELRVGFPSPLFHNGRLYLIDNSGNLTAVNAQTGEQYWSKGIGTVGKASPVWADGKLIVTETNGNVTILRPGDTGAEVLSHQEATMPDGRYAELYGSPAVAYGRIYFTTEEGLYCLGDPKAPFRVVGSPMAPLVGEETQVGGATALRIVPAELSVRPGATIDFKVLAFDANGLQVGPVNAELSLQNLVGDLSGARLSFPADAGFQAGMVTAKSGALEVAARVRVFPDLPWSMDFEGMEAKPGGWIGAGRFDFAEKDGGKTLVKGVFDGLLRSDLLIGPPSMTNYTIQSDIQLTQTGRRRSDGGLVNSGYILDLMGIHQKVQISSWAAVLRVQQEAEMELLMDHWYTVKLKVSQAEAGATVQAKVWSTGDPEPAAWTLEVFDPYPVRMGSPGLQGYSPSPIYFDNVHVTGN